MNDCITIPLTRGKEALVSKEDAYLAQYKWHAMNTSTNYKFYAVRAVKEPGRPRKLVRMHRLIASSISPVEGSRVRWLNGNSLDNRRENLESYGFRKNVSSFEGTELSGSLSLAGVTKDEIVRVVKTLSAEGRLAFDTVCARLGFRPYSFKTFNRKPKETVVFQELKTILELLPEFNNK